MTEDEMKSYIMELEARIEQDTKLIAELKKDLDGCIKLIANQALYIESLK